jgi:hypothetical protein
VVPDADIVDNPGLREVAQILFGDDADRRLEQYLAERRAVGADRSAPITS